MQGGRSGVLHCSRDIMEGESQMYVVSSGLFKVFEMAKVCGKSNKKIQIEDKIQLFD